MGFKKQKKPSDACSEEKVIFAVALDVERYLYSEALPSERDVKLAGGEGTTFSCSVGLILACLFVVF